MSHARVQIRDAVAARLNTGEIVAYDNVFKSRRRTTARGQVPCLLVYTDNERAERAAVNNGVTLYQRKVELVIRVRGESSDGNPPQDALDALCAQVEAALEQEPSLGSIVKNLLLERTEAGPPSQMSDRELGEVDLVYSAEYFVQGPDPQTIVY